MGTDLRVGHRLKLLVARLVTSSIVGRVIAVTYGNRIPSRDLVVDTTDPAITPQMKAAIYLGLYESAEQRFVRRYLRRDLDVIELGSSLGVISCLIARTVDRSRRVICVEASPRLQDSLRRNLRLNAPDRDVTIVAKAIAYSGSNARFVTGNDNTVGRVESQDGSRRDAELVPTTTLSQLLREQRVERFALVCDIEGMEADIIARDGDALARCDQLIIELHDGLDDTTTIELLRSALEQRHGFTLLQRYGPVCLFDRGESSVGP